MEVKKIIGVLGISFLIVSCSNDVKKTSDTVLESKVDASSCQSQMLENKYVVLWEDGSFTYEEGRDEESFKKEFVEKNLQQIKKVYYDRKIKFFSESETNSVSLNSEIQSSASENAEQLWGQRMIAAEDVWKKNFYGQGVIVGVVDSYVDISHSQLKDQIYTNTNEIPDNGIDDDNNGFIDDYHGMNFTGVSNYTISNVHGTHVSGIIASNHQGLMKGIAPKATLIPAPFISNDGSGSLGDAIKAMNYVTDHGAKVINASWGGSVCVSSLKEAFQAISDKGVLIVVAAGNDGRDLTVSPTYPAAFNLPGQITVGASNENDFMAYFSNSSFSLVHLAAPGDAIFSTTPSEKYDYLKGTSMATPFVTGAAAVLWSAFPSATVAKIKEAIVNSVDITPSHEFRVYSRGRLNLSKAYDYLNK
ncbi:MAG: S8 family serine peptidase [Bdellovibrionaceae bacterium]|nr:S8 family serine peptidase [Pseudobdellovibrionaceae bacterium]NUM58380.1 S8 family serine peptidase [Pseudobdellovibrionaceae bacterium]